MRGPIVIADRLEEFSLFKTPALFLKVNRTVGQYAARAVLKKLTKTVPTIEQSGIYP